MLWSARTKRARRPLVALTALVGLLAAAAPAAGGEEDGGAGPSRSCADYRKLGIRLRSTEFDDHWAMCRLYSAYDPNTGSTRGETGSDGAPMSRSVLLSRDYRERRVWKHVLVVEERHEGTGLAAVGSADVHVYRLRKGAWTLVWSEQEALSGWSGGAGPDVAFVELGPGRFGLAVEGGQVVTFDRETGQAGGCRETARYALGARGLVRVGGSETCSGLEGRDETEGAEGAEEPEGPDDSE